jgi:nucleoid-associated protein YgaU
MKTVRLVLVVGLLGYGVFMLSGCTVRTYQLTRDRIDQDLAGNRGFLQGTPSADTGERKMTRTTQVVEVEFGPKARPVKGKAVAKESMAVEEAYQSEAPVVGQEPVGAPVVRMQPYTVKKGDTLQKIAKDFYGTTKRWMKIYEANRDILKGPDKIYPGQTINIPLEALKEPAENLK